MFGCLTTDQTRKDKDIRRDFTVTIVSNSSQIGGKRKDKQKEYFNVGAVPMVEVSYNQ